jgi:hypothetical protein
MPSTMNMAVIVVRNGARGADYSELWRLFSTAESRCWNTKVGNARGTAISAKTPARVTCIYFVCSTYLQQAVIQRKQGLHSIIEYIPI